MVARVDDQTLPEEVSRHTTTTFAGCEVGFRCSGKSGSVKKEEQSPASPPQSPPALLQEQHQDDEPRDAVVFPELLSARISMLTEDLAAVKQRVATLERAAGRGSGGAFRISSLEGRIAALEAAAVSAPPLAEIAARVTELECAVREPGRPGAYIEILCCICE